MQLQDDPVTHEGQSGPRRTLLFVVNVGWFFLSHRLPLAIAAVREGYEVHVACDIADPAEVDEIEHHGLRCHRLPLRRGGVNPLDELRTIREILGLYRRLRPDLLHLVTLKPIIYGTIAARLIAVRGIVCSISGLGSVFVASSVKTRALRPLVRFVLRSLLATGSAIVIVQNPDDRQMLLDERIVPPERLLLIRGSGVDTQRFKPGPEPPGKPRIILPARMLRDKGVLEFARAATLLRNRGVDVDLVLAGGLDPGNPSALSAEELDTLVRNHGVTWLGHVSDMASVFSRSTIICLPSYREGLPKSLLEAAASGRAIVTTDVPGCREVVEDGVTGLLVPPRSAEALADALQRAVDDPSLRASLGRAAHDKALREYSLDLVVEQTLRAYGMALKQRDGRFGNGKSPASDRIN